MDHAAAQGEATPDRPRQADSQFAKQADGGGDHGFEAADPGFHWLGPKQAPANPGAWLTSGSA